MISLESIKVKYRSKIITFIYLTQGIRKLLFKYSIIGHR